MKERQRQRQTETEMETESFGKLYRTECPYLPKIDPGRERERDRDTDRQTETETDTERERERDRVYKTISRPRFPRTCHSHHNMARTTNTSSPRDTPIEYMHL